MLPVSGEWEYGDGDTLVVRFKHAGEIEGAREMSLQDLSIVMDKMLEKYSGEELAQNDEYWRIQKLIASHPLKTGEYPESPNDEEQPGRYIMSH